MNGHSGISETDVEYHPCYTIPTLHFRTTYQPVSERMLNLEYCPNSVDIVLHNHGHDLVKSMADNKLTYRKPLNMNRSIEYFLKYLIHERNYVADHHQSHCINYEPLGLNDQYDAIERCALRSFINRYHQLPSNHLVADSQSDILNMSLSDRKLNWERKECKDQFPKI